MRKLKKKIISILKFATSGKFQKYRMYEEKMKELDCKINLGKVTENDFKESKSITILREILEKNNRIKVRATEADKIANLDGKVVIIDKNGFERIHIEIQVKTLPEKYNLNKQYSYSCDTKAFNVVLEHITFNPVVLFLVDEQTNRVFWKLISNEYAKSLNIGNQEKKTIYFNNQDLYSENSFIEKISDYCDSLCEIIDKKDANKSLISSNINEYSTEYIEIQMQVDRLNNIFDNELKYIKDMFFKYVWKFGISYNKLQKQTAMGIYFITYGKNDTLIKRFDPRLNYIHMSINFQKNITLETYINKWIEEVKKQYYLKVPIIVENLSDEILNEIVFNFLDKLTMNIKVLEDRNRPYTYYKDEEEINNIINLINGLELFYEEIIKTKDSPNVSNAVAFLTPTYNLTGDFLLFNPFIQFNDDEIELLNKYLNRNNPSVPLKFLDNGEDKKIQLSFLAIQELQKRKKKTVKRIWNKKNIIKSKEDFLKEDKCIRTGYSKEDLIINLKHFFDIVAENYNFVFNKSSYPDKYYLNDLHLIVLDENEIQTYNDYITKNNVFEVKRICNDIKIDEENIISIIESNLECLFLLDTPLYETIRILLYIGVMKNNDYKVKNENVNYSVKFEELPIINYYID